MRSPFGFFPIWTRSVGRREIRRHIRSCRARRRYRAKKRCPQPAAPSLRLGCPAPRWALGAPLPGRSIAVDEIVRSNRALPLFCFLKFRKGVAAVAAGYIERLGKPRCRLSKSTLAQPDSTTGLPTPPMRRNSSIESAPEVPLLQAGRQSAGLCCDHDATATFCARAASGFIGIITTRKMDRAKVKINDKAEGWRTRINPAEPPL